MRSAAALLAAFAVGAGCTPVPTLRNVLAQHYAGYDQVLPASEALLNEKRYEYLPGNIAAFTLTERRNAFAAASWSSKSDYCSINVPLSLFRPKQRNSAIVVHDFDLSLRRALGLKKAKADLQLEDNEIEMLRKVEIRISSPKEYSVQKIPKPDFVQSCLAAMTGRTDIRRTAPWWGRGKTCSKRVMGFWPRPRCWAAVELRLGFWTARRRTCPPRTSFCPGWGGSK